MNLPLDRSVFELANYYCPREQIIPTTPVFGACVPLLTDVSNRYNFFSEVYSTEQTSTAFQRALWALYSELGDLVWPGIIALLFALFIFYVASFLPRVVLLVIIIFAFVGSICTSRPLFKSKPCTILLAILRLLSFPSGCTGLLWWKFALDVIITSKRNDYMKPVPTDAINFDSFLALAVCARCFLSVSVHL